LTRELAYLVASGDKTASVMFYAAFDESLFLVFNFHRFCMYLVA